jgi:hypothetical protein
MTVLRFSAVGDGSPSIAWRAGPSDRSRGAHTRPSCGAIAPHPRKHANKYPRSPRSFGLSASSARGAKRENPTVARDIEPARSGQNGDEMQQARERIAREQLLPVVATKTVKLLVAFRANDPNNRISYPPGDSRTTEKPFEIFGRRGSTNRPKTSLTTVSKTHRRQGPEIARKSGPS